MRNIKIGYQNCDTSGNKRVLGKDDPRFVSPDRVEVYTDGCDVAIDIDSIPSDRAVAVVLLQDINKNADYFCYRPTSSSVNYTGYYTWMYNGVQQSENISGQAETTSYDVRSTNDSGECPTGYGRLNTSVSTQISR